MTYEQPALDFMPTPRPKITREPPPPEDGVSSHKSGRLPVCEDCGAAVHRAINEGRRLAAPSRATKKVIYKTEEHFLCYKHAVERTDEWGIRWDKKK